MGSHFLSPQLVQGSDTPLLCGMAPVQNIATLHLEIYKHTWYIANTSTFLSLNSHSLLSLSLSVKSPEFVLLWRDYCGDFASPSHQACRLHPCFKLLVPCVFSHVIWTKAWAKREEDKIPLSFLTYDSNNKLSFFFVNAHHKGVVHDVLRGQEKRVIPNGRCQQGFPHITDAKRIFERIWELKERESNKENLKEFFSSTSFFHSLSKRFSSMRTGESGDET